MHSKTQNAVSIGLGLTILGAVAVTFFYARPGAKTLPAKPEPEAAKSSLEEALKQLAGSAVEVQPAEIEIFVKAPGIIDFHPKHALRIHPAYSGVVQRVNKNLGDIVQAGEVLASIESNQGVQIYAVSSPIKGVVLSRNVGVGQSVAPEDELFSVGDASVLQAKLAIAARDVGKVKADMPVILVTDDDHLIRSTLHFLTPVLMSDSRTATALVDFSSPEMLPGMFVTGAIVVGQRAASAALPASFCDGSSLPEVVVVLTRGRAEERRVRFGAKDYGHCEVLSGLVTGEKVLPASTLLTLAESQEPEDEHENSHDD